MSKLILRLLAVAAVTALVLPGCKDSGVGNGDSAGMNTFLSRFSEETSGNGGGGECSGHTLTIRANPAAGGTVLPSGVHCYSAGTSVNVTVISSNSGYFFTGWSGASTSMDTTVTFTMNSNQTLTANFGQVITGTFTDSRGGQNKVYRTVKIGNLPTWMAENLNYETSSGSWCYDEDASNCTKYGRLYDWNAAKSACPTGWRLPDTTDWNALVRVLGGLEVAGRKLKSRTGWDGTDDIGFSALPGGFRSTGGYFHDAGNDGFWWSATEFGSGRAWYRFMVSGDVHVNENHNSVGHGFSARCARD